MKGIIADVNIEGQISDLVVTFFQSAEWREFWEWVGIPLLSFGELGVNRRSPDDIVWQTCQDNGLILITGNRNDDGPTSLEATIRARLQADSLPVITVARAKTLGAKSQYTAQVGIRILDILLNIDDYRGIGRLYAP